MTVETLTAAANALVLGSFGANSKQSCEGLSEFDASKPPRLIARAQDAWRNGTGAGVWCRLERSEAIVLASYRH